jgi:pilus assembly protein Flp/PilA
MTATIGKLNMNTICKMLRDQRGATTIECGLIVALIAIAAVSALQGMGDPLGSTFNATSSTMANP